MIDINSIFEIFRNEKYLKILEMVNFHNLTRDLCFIANLPYDTEKEIDKFIEEFKKDPTNSDKNLKNFPIETILKFGIPVYNGFMNNTITFDTSKLIIQIDNISSDDIKNSIISEIFIDFFEKYLSENNIIDITLLSLKYKKEIESLNKKLKDFIKDEKYEEAAITRDKINKIKNEMVSKNIQE